PPGTPPTTKSVCSDGASLIIATSLGTTTGLTSTAGSNFRVTTAARGTRLAIIGGGGAGGAIGTGASINALNNPRSGSVSTNSSGTKITTPINAASKAPPTNTIHGRRVFPESTKLDSNMAHSLPVKKCCVKSATSTSGVGRYPAHPPVSRL